MIKQWRKGENTEQSAVLLPLITLGIRLCIVGIRLAEADEMGAIGRLSAARASSSPSSSKSTSHEVSRFDHMHIVHI